VSFTDDDLKRLKEFVDADGLRPAKSDNIDIETDKLTIRRNVMRALLARLEAAEEPCNLLMRNAPSVRGQLFNTLMREKLEAWRKACGK